MFCMFKKELKSRADLSPSLLYLFISALFININLSIVQRRIHFCFLSGICGEVFSVHVVLQIEKIKSEADIRKEIKELEELLESVLLMKT